MAEPQTNLRVRISADLADIKTGLASIRGDLAKFKSEAARSMPDAGNWSRGIASARREAGKLLGAYLSFRTVGAVIGGIIQNTRESEEAMAQLRAGIKSTGGIAGVTATQIAAFAGELQKTTTFSDDAIVRMAAVVATFTNIRGAVFKDAIPAILDLSVRLGTDLNSAAIQVGKALNDPVKGITALGRAGVQFSGQQKEVIAALVKTGDVAQAQRIILGELATQMGGSATAAADTLSGALQQTRNAFGDLLEGDSSRGGLKDAKVALQDLAQTLNSPEVKAGFASFVNGLGNLINFAARAVGAVNGIRVAIIDAFAKDSQKTYLGLLAKYSALQGDLADLEGGPLRRVKLIVGGRSGEVDPLKGPAENAEKLRAKLQDVNSLLAKMRSQQGAKATSAAAISDNPTGAAFSFDPGKAGKASDEARRKAEALRKEMERLEAQSKQAMERLREEEVKREEALRDQLEGAEIELLRATGHNAEASFREIEARYGELLDRMRKNSNVAGVAIVEQLIDIKKVQARLEEFRTKMQEITGALQAGQTSLGAQAAGGLIGDTEAEEQAAALRARSLQQLQDLRTAVQAYYEATKDPTVLAFLQELTGNIGEVAESQNRLQQQAQDVAVDSLSTFLTDLATGAKSAKDAFKDFVSSFVRGIAQMIAQQLALLAVKTAMRAMGFAVMHTGGIVGAGGTRRMVTSSLLSGEAPRYHTGGIAGLRPNEVPAVLERGEEVLTKNDPRHIRNGGGGASQQPIRNIIVFGEDELANAMAGAAGERVMITHARNNRGAINSE